MSVDKLRGTKHINRISPSDIGLLMSAQSYRPEITQAIRRIKAFNWRPLQMLVVNTISPGPHPKYGGSYPCLKTKNVDGLLATHEPADHADVSVFNDLEKITVKKGDLLINLTGAGSIGRVSVYYGEDKPITNQHIARMSVKPGNDEGYLACFLRSWWGERALEQGVAGSTGQINMVNEHVRSIPVYLPDPLAQKYIGDKVRQAEQLRAWAMRLERVVHRFHAKFIPDQEYLDFNKKTRKVSVNRMTERMDAHFYPGVVEQYLNSHPGKFEGLKSLTLDIYNGQTQPESLEDFCEQITVAHLSASFVKGQPRKVSCPPRSEKFVKPHDILMCNAAHNKAYIGRELTYVHTDKKLLPSTEVMTIRINRDLVPASYVRTYLLSRLGYVKIQSTIRGITAHSYPDDVSLLDIYIPEVEPHLKQKWFKQDELLVQAGNAAELAQKITSCAKTLVEALIEGQLTEQQLIQAQQALEDGDTGLDHAILSKLSSEGFAVEGAKPLFGDLDELYRLLESTAQSEDEE